MTRPGVQNAGTGMNTKSNAKSEESRFTAAPGGFCDVVGFSPGLVWMLVDSQLLCPCGCRQGCTEVQRANPNLLCFHQPSNVGWEIPGWHQYVRTEEFSEASYSDYLDDETGRRDKVRFIGDSPDALELVLLNGESKAGTVMPTLQT